MQRPPVYSAEAADAFVLGAASIPSQVLKRGTVGCACSTPNVLNPPNPKDWFIKDTHVHAHRLMPPLWHFHGQAKLPCGPDPNLIPHAGDAHWTLFLGIRNIFGLISPTCSLQLFVTCLSHRHINAFRWPTSFAYKASAVQRLQTWKQFSARSHGLVVKQSRHRQSCWSRHCLNPWTRAQGRQEKHT